MADDYDVKLNVDASLRIGDVPFEFATATSRSARDLSFHGARLTFDADSVVRLFAFNDESDVDDDKVILQPSKAKTGSLIVFDATKAWTKLSLTADATTDAKASDLLALSASRNLAFNDYRIHKRSDLVTNIVAGRISPRVALRASDVAALKVGEALSFAKRGRIEAQLELSWSDILSTNLASLSEILGVSKTIALRLSAGLTLQAKLEAEDDFVVVFARIANGGGKLRYRALVRRASSSTRSGEASAGATIALANLDDAAAKGIDAIFLELTGYSWSAIESLLEKAATSKTREIANNILRALGAEDPVEPLAKLAERASALRNKLLALTRSRIELGFTYEYERIDSESSLIQLLLTEDELPLWHRSLIGDNKKLVTALAAGKGPKLENYLNETTMKRTSAWGFSLAFRKWAIAGKSEEAKKLVRRTDLAGHEQLTWLGARSYELQWLRDRIEWSAELKASMPKFSVGKVAEMDELKYGLFLSWSEEGELSERRAARWSDAAALWSIAGEDINEKMPRGGRRKARFELKLANEAFLAWLRITAASKRSDYAEALAAAMPWDATFARLRDFNSRIATYDSLWRSYLIDPQPAASYALQAREQLEEMELPLLAQREMNANVAADLTFTGRVARNPKTSLAIDRHIAGAKQLDERIRFKKDFDRDDFMKRHNELQQFWVDSHHARALGFFIATAFATEGLLHLLERTLTITAANGDAVVITST